MSLFILHMVEFVQNSKFSLYNMYPIYVDNEKLIA